MSDGIDPDGRPDPSAPGDRPVGRAPAGPDAEPEPDAIGGTPDDGAGAPEPGPTLTGGRRRRSARTAAIEIPALLMAAVVVALVAGIAVFDHGRTSASVPPSRPVQVNSVPAVDAEFSSLYCVGGAGTSGLGHGLIYLTNRGTTTSTAILRVVNDRGAAAFTTTAVPPGAQIVVDPAKVEPGNWLAATVDVRGGGVAATEAVEGSTGWSMAPCSTVTSDHWYFASAATSPGSGLHVTAYNPMKTPAVISLRFVTSAGLIEPQPFQGIVVAPETLVDLPVGAYVQDQLAVATEVVAGSGRVVAAQLQSSGTASRHGLSLELGTPQVSDDWVLPSTSTVSGAGGQVDLVVLNPGGSAEKVTVHVRLASGPVAPWSASIPPGATWQLALGSQSRIPKGVSYVTTVRSGSPGVVVSRVVTAPAGSRSPQWGTTVPVTVSEGEAHTRTWVLPAPGTATQPTVSGARIGTVAVANCGNGPITVTLSALTPSGPAPVTGAVKLAVAPGGLVMIDPGAAATAPLLLRSSGAAAVSEDLVPAGAPGVVTLPGAPAD